MAFVTIPDYKIALRETEEIVSYLAGIGIDYECWETPHSIVSNAPAEEILAAYSEEIERLKAKGSYVTADVIDVSPETPGLDAMLAKFSREHWHDEDEVRFIIEGRGLFHIAPKDGDVTAIEVVAGDLIRVPRGTLHWFNLCEDRRIRAIRLFQDVSGWTPNYTDSGVDENYQSLCFGQSFLPQLAVL
jgi:1,2-dihydroxy-3-keto-5-methylthiopentene dioxygenase